MEGICQLIEKSHRGDLAAREELVRENTGLVWCIVRRFENRGHEREDLFQIGTIGLLKAIDRFDLSFQVKFSTYAVPLITGEIQRFLRDDGMIKVSRSLKELSGRIFRTREQLIKSCGREPTIEELAKEMQIDKESIVEALESGYEVESLYQPVLQEEGDKIRLMDRVEEKRDSEEEVLDRILIRQLLGTLAQEERKLIYLRYFQDRTQAAIGEELGISQVQVSRMEKKILERMRKQVYGKAEEKRRDATTKKCTKNKS